MFEGAGDHPDRDAGERGGVGVVGVARDRSAGGAGGAGLSGRVWQLEVCEDGSLRVTAPDGHWYGESIDLDRVVTWLLWSADHSYADFGAISADDRTFAHHTLHATGTRF